jgi:hypothetical protein
VTDTGAGTRGAEEASPRRSCVDGGRSARPKPQRTPTARGGAGPSRLPGCQRCSQGLSGPATWSSGSRRAAAACANTRRFVCKPGSAPCYCGPSPACSHFAKIPTHPGVLAKCRDPCWRNAGATANSSGPGLSLSRSAAGLTSVTTRLPPNSAGCSSLERHCVLTARARWCSGSHPLMPEGTCKVGRLSDTAERAG